MFSKKIILCTYCKGEGTYEELVDHHRKDYRSYDCKACDGAGRLIEIIETRYEKFKKTKD